MNVPVTLDDSVEQLAGGRILLGGDQNRLVRLRPGAESLLSRLAFGTEPAVLALARTLLRAGLAHPCPQPVRALDVTVVVPVRDRVEQLTRCLAALGTQAPVLVVDDGSADPAGLAAVCAAHGAQILHLPHNVGPGGARNAGVGATTTSLLAFLDSDCTPPPGWLGRLLGHFDDPAVGAVAPRIRGSGGIGVLERYAADRGPLDLGAQHAGVRPGSRVSYVPTAGLLVRRSALPAGPFDPALRYGEDVDLVWRLHDAGWSVRYDPRVVVAHEEPTRWSSWLHRRHQYGTSAAPLAQRHGRRLTPLVLPPWTTAAYLLLLAGWPLPAAAAAAVPAARLQRRLRRSGLPIGESVRTAVRWTGRGVLATSAGLGGAGTVVTGPLLCALLLPRRTRRAAAAALLVPPLLEWHGRRPQLDPVRWSVVRLIDDLAYASGVWRGCWKARTTQPLRPSRSRPH